MNNYERAQTDAKFGLIMVGMTQDSVFMHLYEQMENHDADEDPRPAG